MRTSLTPSERRRRARLVAKGAWQTRGANPYTDGSTLPDSRVQDEIDRIDARGEKRWKDEAEAYASQVRTARTAVASAKAALRAAKGPEKTAARRALREQEQQLTRAENAARKHGLRI